MGYTPLIMYNEIIPNTDKLTFTNYMNIKLTGILEPPESSDKNI